MQALKTRINPRSDEFRTNADAMRKLVEELCARLCHGAVLCQGKSLSLGRPCLSLAHYVTGLGPMDGATAAGGRSCCLSSVEKARSRVQDYGQGTVGMKRVNVITNEGTRLCARRLRISSLFSSGAR